MFAGIGIDIAVLMDRHNSRSWGIGMDYSFFRLGASFSPEGGLSSADGSREYKLLFARDNLSSRQGVEGFVNAFRNAMSNGGATDLSNKKLPLLLPVAGKLLPGSTDVDMKETEIPADYAGFGILASRQGRGAENMLENSLSVVFNPFAADLSPIQPGVQQTSLAGVTWEASGVQASRLSGGESMNPSVEEGPLEQLVFGVEGRSPSSSVPLATGSVEEAVLAERRHVLFPKGYVSLSHDLLRMAGDRVLTEAGAVLGGQEAGMAAESSSFRVPGMRPAVPRQEIPVGETDGNAGGFPVTDGKEIRPKMAVDPVSPEIRPGIRREDSSLATLKYLEGQGAGVFNDKRDVAIPVAEVSPAQPTAGLSTRPAIALPFVGAAQTAVSNSRFPQAGNGKSGVVPGGREGGTTMPGSPAAQLQMPEKGLAESVVRGAVMSSGTDNRLDTSFSFSVLEDGDRGAALMGSRQAAAQTTSLPGTAAASAMPRHTEINIPLGHAAWEQSLARQVLQAGQGQLRQLHIKLNPSNLGSIDIKLQLEGDSANIAFSSQHAVVREAVEASLPRLREMFSGSGINLGNVDVGGQDTAWGQEREAHGGEFSPGNLFGGDEDEQGGVMNSSRQSLKGKDDNQLLDYYV